MVKRTLLWSLFLTVCASFLFGDAAFAMSYKMPLRHGTVWSPGAEGVLLARRKRRTKRRRRKKPKPKPKPSAQPDETKSAPADAPEGASGGGDAIPLGPGGRSRVDFDAMQIRGQTTKSGEVQILERKDTELKSMVKRRTSFREEIIETVFPDKAGALK